MVGFFEDICELAQDKQVYLRTYTPICFSQSFIPHFGPTKPHLAPSILPSERKRMLVKGSQKKRRKPNFEDGKQKRRG